MLRHYGVIFQDPRQAAVEERGSAATGTSLYSNTSRYRCAPPQRGKD